MAVIRDAMSKLLSGLCAALACSMLLGNVQAQAVTTVNSGVEEAMSRFLTAFNNLDWPSFRDCFSKSPTVFFPFPQVTRRVEGEEFDKVWQDYFNLSRKRATAQG